MQNSNVKSRDLEIRDECWKQAILTLGTSYIFSLRTRKYQSRIRLISILGIIVPITIGGIAGVYGANSSALVWSLIVAGPFSILQLVLSAISLSYKWDDQLAYSLESSTDNRVLSDSFTQLAKLPPSDIVDHERKYEILLTKLTARTGQDDKYLFSDKENRTGMRYGLMIFGRACATCKIAPPTMEPTHCKTCGNF